MLDPSKGSKFIRSRRIDLHEDTVYSAKNFLPIYKGIQRKSITQLKNGVSAELLPARGC